VVAESLKASRAVFVYKQCHCVDMMVCCSPDLPLTRRRDAMSRKVVAAAWHNRWITPVGVQASLPRSSWHMVWKPWNYMLPRSIAYASSCASYAVTNFICGSDAV
jgi:hypothetical protein